MTKEEIEMYYDLLGFKFEAAIGVLYAKDLVDGVWVRQSRKRFFDKLEREHKLHFRHASDYGASIRLFFSMMNDKPGKYVSLSDIARQYSHAYLRIWELINNYDFDDEARAALIESSKNASFNLTPSKWISRTKAGGIRVKR